MKIKLVSTHSSFDDVCHIIGRLLPLHVGLQISSVLHRVNEETLFYHILVLGCGATISCCFCRRCEHRDAFKYFKNKCYCTKPSIMILGLENTSLSHKFYCRTSFGHEKVSVSPRQFSKLFSGVLENEHFWVFRKFLGRSILLLWYIFLQFTSIFNNHTSKTQIFQKMFLNALIFSIRFWWKWAFFNTFHIFWFFVLDGSPINTLRLRLHKDKFTDYLNFLVYNLVVEKKTRWWFNSEDCWKSS